MGSMKGRRLVVPRGGGNINITTVPLGPEGLEVGVELSLVLRLGAVAAEVCSSTVETGSNARHASAEVPVMRLCQAS